MKADKQQNNGSQPMEVLLAGCLGVVVGAIVGGIGMLIYTIFAGDWMSIGYGFLGLVYWPLFGVFTGGIIGFFVGIGVAEFVARRQRNNLHS